MLKINENNKINAKDIYAFVEVKTVFHVWIKRCIDTADLKLNEDFSTNLIESTGGRPATEYQFTIQAAKEICLISATSKAKELRRWLISLDEKRSNLELMTVKEAVFAMKVVNCLKYIVNQKESRKLHESSFISDNNDKIESKFINAEFNKYRSKIIGWNKDQTDKAIEEFLNTHTGYPKNKVKSLDMSSKLSIMDIGEAIRVAVLDILYANHDSTDMAVNFSNLCKNLANEMKVEMDKENHVNLFRDKKEDIVEVKDIKMIK